MRTSGQTSDSAPSRGETEVSRPERFTSWAFYMEGKRWFEGNRALVTNENVELPVLDGFRMLERLGVHRVDAHAEGVGALAGDRAVIIYHHADAWWVDGTLPRDGRAGRPLP